MATAAPARPRKEEIFRPIVEQLLSYYAGPENPQYRHFYEEVISRCVADVAGTLQTREHSISQAGSQLNAMYKAIEPSYGAECARGMILRNTSSYSKGQVHTPHPTEVFSEEAISAEESVVRILLANRQLFQLRGNGERIEGLSGEARAQLTNALKTLAEKISAPLTSAMTIPDEMRRSVRFSQRQFNSVPIIADTLLQATNTHSSQLGFDELAQFAHLIEPDTWSPGDQDSKPGMTAAKLQEGLNLNQRAMMYHYFRRLTVFADSVNASSIPNKEDRERIHNKIQLMMYRLLQTGHVNDERKRRPIDKAYVAERLIGQSADKDARENTSVAERYKAYAETEFFKSFQDNLDALKMTSPGAYASHDDFLKDLRELRSYPQLHSLHEPGRRHINFIDSVIIQAMNFKNTALRVQIRQNAEMHTGVMNTLVNLVKDKLPPDLAAQIGNLHNPDDASAIEHFIEALHSNTSFSAAIHKIIHDELPRIEKSRLLEKAAAYSESPNQNPKPTKEEQAQVDLYQTLSSMGLAVQNPDRIPRYLIAECANKTDMLKAFFLLKTMEQQYPKAAVKGKVEIVSLVEHPDRIMNQNGKNPAIDMVTGALDNPYFLAHHQTIHRYDHLLNDWSIRDGKLEQHRLTVADVKREHNLKLLPGDETRKIEGVKMMMGAGSDVTKGGGVAAAAVMMNVMEQSREALLNHNPPILLVDYIGCGGGIHRTQPVSTAFETAQGRSMRQSAENIAQKVLGLLTRHLRNLFAMDKKEGQDIRTLPFLFSPENPNQKAATYSYYARTATDNTLMCRVNMGNMYGLPAQPNIWKELTEPQTHKMINAYNKLYNSEEFAALMSYSANFFVGLTQFAARPGKRVEVGASEDNAFPPRISVKDVIKTRAIGFGASLNAAGINAPMFFGGSEYLSNVPDIPGRKDIPPQEAEKRNLESLKYMYLNDPKAQDTINRMTYGVIMADMDIAWKYQGLDQAPDEATLHHLARLEPKGNPALMAKKCLAEIHLEYNAVTEKLLTLHEAVGPKLNAKTKTPRTGKLAVESLLASLPRPLKEQLTLSRKNMEEPRKQLAELFKQMLEGEVNSAAVTRDFDSARKKLSLTNGEPDRYKDVVYPAMGTIYECTEHTPRAYTRPLWVKAVEGQQQLAA